MKKLLSLLLVAMMLMSCASAALGEAKITIMSDDNTYDGFADYLKAAEEGLRYHH